MPFIKLITNVGMDDATKTAVKAAFGEAITAVPGKSEAWLMVQIDADCDLWFKGDDSPAAIAEVSVFGHADHSAYEKLTSRICSVLQEKLSIPPSRTYVKYAETDEWGWNNMNF